MENITCLVCDKSFCSRYNLLRHKRNIHADMITGEIHEQSPGAHLGAPGAHLLGAHSGAPGAHLGAHSGAHLPGAHSGAPGAHLLGAHSGAHSGVHLPGADSGAQLGAPPPPQEENMVFQHPFTMMISGPTACGKTTMVKELLQNHSTKIQPGVQRIVWLYKRWQPLYTVIERTVIPKVEFIKDIPTDLDDDDFFDVKMNNLLILDDLFSESGKDKRITDLFTEGSHHRSLSVISINQNLFGTKDPTQRRNCHYMVLFNNPADKQSVMTLARQMYPGQSDILLKQFAKATKYPYGHLLVDLKPFTPENQRLKCIINEHKSHVTPKEPIKEDIAPEVNHSTVGLQTVHIEDKSENNLKNNLENNSVEIMENNGQACDDCGQLFDTVHDVQRHVKNGWCPENRDQKKRKYDEMSDSEETVEDNEAYVQLWKRARETNDQKFDQFYSRFIDNGEESDTAQEMAEERIQPYNEKEFFGKYITLIDTYILPLRNNTIHTRIMAETDSLISKGYNSTSAVTKVLRKHKHSFQDLFDVEFTDDENDDVSEDDSDSENI